MQLDCNRIMPYLGKAGKPNERMTMGEIKKNHMKIQ